MVVPFASRKTSIPRFVHSYLSSSAVLVLASTFFLPVIASSFQVTLEWDASSGMVDGYRVFEREHWENYNYVNPAWEGLDATCTIYNLADGLTYYFVVRAFNEYGESDDSNEVRVSAIGVNELETGRYETTGKGKNKTQTFMLTNTFYAGDVVVFRIYIIDTNTGLPVADATAEIAISHSESTTLISDPSGNDGMAEATWKTSAPKGKKVSGTAPGIYEATVTDIVANDYVWDGNNTVTTFVIQ